MKVKHLPSCICQVNGEVGKKKSPLTVVPLLLIFLYHLLHRFNPHYAPWAISSCMIHFLFFVLFLFVFSLILFYFFTLQYCIGFAIHQHNPPRVYISSHSWTPLPPPSPYRTLLFKLAWLAILGELSKFTNGRNTCKCTLATPRGKICNNIVSRL